MISRTRRSTSGSGNLAIAQREGEIVVNGHRVVDDRELEHLGDVAILGRQVGDILAVEQDLAFGRLQQAGNDVEKRGLAAAGRAEQRIGAAVVPFVMDFLQRIIGRRFRIRPVGVADMVEIDACHGLSPHAVWPAVPAIARPSVPKAIRWRVSMKSSTAVSGFDVVDAMFQHDPARTGAIDVDEAFRTGDFRDDDLGRQGGGCLMRSLQRQVMRLEGDRAGAIGNA